MTSETIPTPAVTALPTTQFAPAIRILNDAIQSHAFPGCAFGVFADGRVALESALGRFTYSDTSASIQPGTVFDVASLTKVVATTATAMLLYQRGVLDLELPVAELLPGFIVGREPGSYARHVKIRHLLAHNSGLPGYVQFFKEHHSPLGLMRACLELPIEKAPGERAEYSDPGFILLGKALDVLLGEPMPRFAEREIFGPLGMSSSCFRPAFSARTSIPPTEEDTTLRYRVIQGEVQDENAYVLNGCAGHAGLFSNVADLLLFSSEILSATAGSGKIFQSSTIERFSERQAPEGSSRALGWDTPSQNSSSGRHFTPTSIGHLGYSGCSLWIDLAAQIAVVLLTNRTWPNRESDQIRVVRPAFHDAIRQSL